MIYSIEMFLFVLAWIKSILYLSLFLYHLKFMMIPFRRCIYSPLLCVLPHLTIISHKNFQINRTIFILHLKCIINDKWYTFGSVPYHFSINILDLRICDAHNFPMSIDCLINNLTFITDFIPLLAYYISNMLPLTPKE